MSTPGKWSKEYWEDLGERVLATLLGALLGVITVTGTPQVDWSDGNVIWALLGVPVAVSLLKGLLLNLQDTPLPTASFVSVSSRKTKTGHRGEVGAVQLNSLWFILGVVGIVLIVLLLAGVL